MRFRLTLAAAAAAATTLLALPAAQADVTPDPPSAQAAHTGVTTRTPAPGRTTRNVKRVAVGFSQRLSTGKIEIFRGSTKLKPASSGPSGSTIAASFRKQLPAGSYTVRWRALASDGHAQTGSWSFKAR